MTQGDKYKHTVREREKLWRVRGRIAIFAYRVVKEDFEEKFTLEQMPEGE